MINQFSFMGKERASFRRSRTRTIGNRPKLRANTAPSRKDVADKKASTNELSGRVGPGILSRLRRLFNSIRRNEERREIFQYTPSQNPEEFLENLRQSSETSAEGDFDRLASYEVTTASPNSKIPTGYTRFVCISDTHSTHRRMQIPEGDVLIHCGDFTERGFMKEVVDFNKWLGKLPHKHKIVIAGNHEISFDKSIMEGVAKSENVRFRVLGNIPESAWRDWQSVLTNCTYLEDGETEINGIRIYGSPWQPNCGNLAFNLKRGDEILEKWKLIPEGIDILMTHGPPAGRLDLANRGTRAGCVDLLNEVQLRVKPKYHVFGHIHDGYGTDCDGHTTYINCSAVDAFRNPIHHAVVFDFPNKEKPKSGTIPDIIVTEAL